MREVLREPRELMALTVIPAVKVHVDRLVSPERRALKESRDRGE